MPLTSPFHVRWMIRKDIQQVLEIEQLCFSDPWSEEEFIHCLRQRNCIGMVLDEPYGSGEMIAGFMVYELNKSNIEITDFAVIPSRQRNGAGTALLDKLVSKLSKDRRSKLVLKIRESNLDGQLFFRAMGFKCTGTKRQHFTNREDAYLMELRIDSDGQRPQLPAARQV